MTRTIIGPIFVFLLISSAVALMSVTDLFNPLMKFIHSSEITPVGAGACLLFSVFGFAAYYCLLRLLYGHFIPRLETGKKQNKRQPMRIKSLKNKRNS